MASAAGYAPSVEGGAFAFIEQWFLEAGAMALQGHDLPCRFTIFFFHGVSGNRYLVSGVLSVGEFSTGRPQSGGKAFWGATISI